MCSVAVLVPVTATCGKTNTLTPTVIVASHSILSTCTCVVVYNAYNVQLAHLPTLSWSLAHVSHKWSVWGTQESRHGKTWQGGHTPVEFCRVEWREVHVWTHDLFIHGIATSTLFLACSLHFSPFSPPSTSISHSHASPQMVVHVLHVHYTLGFCTLYWDIIWAFCSTISTKHVYIVMYIHVHI